jgi:hypothetical protein
MLWQSLAGVSQHSKLQKGFKTPEACGHWLARAGSAAGKKSQRIVADKDERDESVILRDEVDERNSCVD